jgi:hypothetical protein
VRAWLADGWALLGRLPPPSRVTRPWLAATLGFFFVGFGIMLYFRKLPDVLVGLALILPLGIAGSSSSGTSNDPALAWWWWVVAAIAGLYGLLRAESANRQLASIARVSPASSH